MAKILISLLGTGRQAKNEDNKNEYETTNYIIDKTLYKDEKYVSSPIIKHYNIDTLFLIGTNKSMWDNINNRFNGDINYELEILEKKEQGILKESDLVPLNALINKRLNSNNSKCFIVNDGENEDELWTIFNKFIEILENIQDGDEVYFEITHLFRSLSVMSFVMSEFGKTYKQFKIAGVFYGMWKIGEPSKIINLSIFFELLDWARAISNLKYYGNSFELMKLINMADVNKDIQKTFENFSNALSISDVGALQQSIKILKGKIELFKSHDNKIISLISKNLLEFINKLDIDSLAKFQFELSKWYIDNKNFAMAYMTLTEAVISAICENENFNAASKEDRKEAQNILFNEYQYGSKEDKAIFQAYTKVNGIRVNIAHKMDSSGTKTKTQPKNSINNIEKYYYVLKALIN